MPLQLYADRCAARRVLLDAALERVRDVGRAEESVREAFVFGSYASGEIGPTSDLDIFIVRESELGIVDRIADLAFGSRSEVAIDFVVVTPEERATTFARSSFGANVLATARHIYAA